MNTKLFVAFLFSGFSALAISCGSVDRVTDCHAICDRYQDCFDDGYDVSSCRDRCTELADNDTSFESKVDACDDCIDDRSCSSATFNCAAQCSSIVP